MIVRQVKNAMQILEFFASHQRPALSAEIADHFGWPRSSTANLIETLAACGVLHEPRHRGGYYPTHRLVSLSSEIVTGDTIIEDLKVSLATIARRTGETSVVAGLAGLNAVFLQVVEAEKSIRYFTNVGVTLPLHATASGRALLSLLSDSELERVLSRTEYNKYSSSTPASADEVRAEIQQSRERGYFLNINQYEKDLAAVAVPLEIEGRQLALMSAGPVWRINQDTCGELSAILLEERGKILKQFE